MTNYIAGKTIVITGAASGFGKLVSEKVAAKGAHVVCADINEADVLATVDGIKRAGGSAIAVVTDVTDPDQMSELAQRAINEFHSIDVMLNNAGIMPLAFFADHKEAAKAWSKCIDINIKGVLNGIVAVYDHMIAQGRGHVINVSSIYGNFPVVGAGVYGATKAAVNYLSESLRVEGQGKIKVSLIKPTGVGGTGLSAGVINPAASVGIFGQNLEPAMAKVLAQTNGELDPNYSDHERVEYFSLNAEYVADQIIYAIDQPWGVSISDITIRASGEALIL